MSIKHDGLIVLMSIKQGPGGSSTTKPQGSILSPKMVAWVTKLRLWRPKFKSGGQHDHQLN